MTESLIRISQAAQLLGIPLTTMDRYRTSGLIVAARFDGRGRAGGSWLSEREIAIAKGVRQILQLGLHSTVAGAYAKRWREHPEIEISISALLPGINLNRDGTVLSEEQDADAQQELLATG